MNLFLLNILLAFVWSAVTGEFSIGTFGIGFIIGYLILLIASPVIDPNGYTRKLWLVIGLTLYFLKELVVSSFRVAVDVIRPGELKMHSGVVGIPLEVEGDFQITLLANMISLTPGTLSLDVSEDRKTLFIHAMYIENDDPEVVRNEIKNGMERVVIRTFGK
jgi:multicomponent Na+:H+ antiporter subunit E